MSLRSLKSANTRVDLRPPRVFDIPSGCFRGKISPSVVESGQMGTVGMLRIKSVGKFLVFSGLCLFGMGLGGSLALANEAPEEGDSSPASRVQFGTSRARTLRDAKGDPYDWNWQYLLKFGVDIPFSGVPSDSQSSGGPQKSPASDAEESEWSLGLGGELAYPVSIQTQTGELNYSARFAFNVGHHQRWDEQFYRKSSWILALQTSIWQFPQSLLAAWGPGVIHESTFGVGEQLWRLGVQLSPLWQSSLKSGARTSSGVGEESNSWGAKGFGFEGEVSFSHLYELAPFFWLHSSALARVFHAQRTTPQGKTERIEFQRNISLLIGISKEFSEQD